MKTWYIRNNDEHLGPYSFEELKVVGLYSDDYVWKEGMPKWTKANSLAELKDLLITVEHSLFASETSAAPETASYPASGHKPREKGLWLKAFLGMLSFQRK